MVTVSVMIADSKLLKKRSKTRRARRIGTSGAAGVKHDHLPSTSFESPVERKETLTRHCAGLVLRGRRRVFPRGCGWDPAGAGVPGREGTLQEEGALAIRRSWLVLCVQR